MVFSTVQQVSEYSLSLSECQFTCVCMSTCAYVCMVFSGCQAWKRCTAVAHSPLPSAIRRLCHLEHHKASSQCGRIQTHISESAELRSCLFLSFSFSLQQRDRGKTLKKKVFYFLISQTMLYHQKYFKKIISLFLNKCHGANVLLDFYTQSFPFFLFYFMFLAFSSVVIMKLSLF